MSRPNYAERKRIAAEEEAERNSLEFQERLRKDIEADRREAQAQQEADDMLDAEYSNDRIHRAKSGKEKRSFGC